MDQKRSIFPQLFNNLFIIFNKLIAHVYTIALGVELLYDDAPIDESSFD